VEKIQKYTTWDLTDLTKEVEKARRTIFLNPFLPRIAVPIATTTAPTIAPTTGSTTAPTTAPTTDIDIGEVEELEEIA